MGVRMKSKKEDKNVWVTTDWLKIIIIICVIGYVFFGVSLLFVNENLKWYKEQTYLSWEHDRNYHYQVASDLESGHICYYGTTNIYCFDVINKKAKLGAFK